MAGVAQSLLVVQTAASGFFSGGLRRAQTDEARAPMSHGSRLSSDCAHGISGGGRQSGRAASWRKKPGLDEAVNAAMICRRDHEPV
jgi:hypothetical protein